jgi:DNA-binding NarL/FixJ family response regulator
VGGLAEHKRGPSRLLIADNQPLFRCALSNILNEYSDFEVVAEANDGREALELTRRLRPDLVLIDVAMPLINGLAATRTIKQEFPETGVLILTAFKDPEYLLEAIEGGAAGYILKTATPQDIMGAVEDVLRGETPLDRELCTLLLRQLILERQEIKSPVGISASRRPLEQHPGEAPLDNGFAPREIQVLRLVSVGRTNREIAQALLISTSSVKKHLQRVVSKLGVSDRVQAAVRAVELGLLSEDDRE